MMGYGSCDGNKSPEQKAEVKKFLDDTKELRKSLLLKRFEYSEATRKDETTMKDLETFRKEIFELKLKIHELSPWDKE